MTLTPEQHAVIHRVIDSLELRSPELIAEVTDHFFCAVEERMSRGERFDHALANTNRAFDAEAVKKAFGRQETKRAYRLLGKHLLAQFRGTKLLMTLLTGTLFGWLVQNADKPFLAYRTFCDWGYLLITIALFLIPSTRIIGYASFPIRFLRSVLGPFYLLFVVSFIFANLLFKKDVEAVLGGSRPLLAGICTLAFLYGKAVLEGYLAQRRLSNHREPA